MADSRFFVRNKSKSLKELAELSGAVLHRSDDGDYVIDDVAALDRADDHQLSFLDNPKYLEVFRQSRSAACIIKEKFIKDAPSGTRLLIADDPYRSYALIAQYFYPYVPLQSSISPNAHIDPTATIGKDCCIAPGVVIGKHVILGDRVMIGANTVLHDGVVIGDDTRIGALCSISHTLVGTKVIIHRGVHIGQDGFGFSMGRDGHVKVPQLGRVVIGDHVEIGAATCIDRGTGPDTIIGDGTKIDNLVQIGHNVQVGRNCIIVSQTGIAGSSRLADGVVLGGQVGIAGHLRIGAGARLAAQSGVAADIPAGAIYGGSPAVPIKDWHRQSVTLAKLIKHKKDVETATTEGRHEQ